MILKKMNTKLKNVKKLMINLSFSFLNIIWVFYENLNYF